MPFPETWHQHVLELRGISESDVIIYNNMINMVIKNGDETEESSVREFNFW